jgi:hypothetical protein
MAVKKNAKSLESKAPSLKKVLAEMGVEREVGIVRYTDSFKLGSLIDLLMSEGLDAHTIGDIVQIYTDAKHNL